MFFCKAIRRQLDLIVANQISTRQFLEKMMSKTQDSIDAETTAVTKLTADFGDFVTTVDASLATANTEIADLAQQLANANITIDLGPLTTAIGGASAAVAAAKAALPPVLPETVPVSPSTVDSAQG